MNKLVGSALERDLTIDITTTDRNSGLARRRDHSRGIFCSDRVLCARSAAVLRPIRPGVAAVGTDSSAFAFVGNVDGLQGVWVRDLDADSLRFLIEGDSQPPPFDPVQCSVTAKY